jgi:hypothetical protein
MSDTFTVYAQPIVIPASTDASVFLANGSGGTLYYGTSSAVSSTSNQGSLTPGQGVTLTAAKWVVSASQTSCTALSSDEGNVASQKELDDAGTSSLGTSVYNATASNLKKTRVVMGKALSASAAGVIAVVGDSNSGGAQADPAVNSYPSRLLDLLEAAGHTIAGTGLVLPYNNTFADSRMVFTGGTWTILSTSGKTPIALSAAASGKKVTFTSDRTGTVVNVLYPGSGSAYGPFTVLIFLVAALVLTNLASLGALALFIVNSRRERETTDKGIQLLITEGTKEREASRKERQEILNRKAQGDKAVIYDLPEGEEQAVPYGDDERFLGVQGRADEWRLLTP